MYKEGFKPIRIYDSFSLHPVRVYSHNPEEEGIIYTSDPNFLNWNEQILNVQNPNNIIFVRRDSTDWIIYQQQNKLKWRIPNSDGELYEKNGIYYAYLGLPNLGRTFKPNLIDLSYRPQRNQDLYPLSKVRFRFPDMPWILGLDMKLDQFDLYRFSESRKLFDPTHRLASFKKEQITISFDQHQLNLCFGSDVSGTFEGPGNKYYWFKFPMQFDYYSNIGDIAVSFDCEQREDNF